MQDAIGVDISKDTLDACHEGTSRYRQFAKLQPGSGRSVDGRQDATARQSFSKPLVPVIAASNTRYHATT